MGMDATENRGVGSSNLPPGTIIRYEPNSFALQEKGDSLAGERFDDSDKTSGLHRSSTLVAILLTLALTVASQLLEVKQPSAGGKQCHSSMTLSGRLIRTVFAKRKAERLTTQTGLCLLLTLSASTKR